MIFGVLKFDHKVFTGDKLRISVNESFLAPGLSFHATLSHEISVDAGVTWYDVSLKKMVDWIFSSAGVKTITLRLTTSTNATATFTKDVTVLSLTAQNLFSNDSDLYKLEPEIDQYLPKKWSSWNLNHLRAQQWIMDWLDAKRVHNKLGQKYAAADLLDIEQVNQLSAFKALEMIYEGNINIVGDVSTLKRDKYRELANEQAAKSQLSLNFDSAIGSTETQRTDLLSVEVRRG